jgi:hypothetical protein
VRFVENQQLTLGHRRKLVPAIEVDTSCSVPRLRRRSSTRIFRIASALGGGPGGFRCGVLGALCQLDVAAPQAARLSRALVGYSSLYNLAATSNVACAIHASWRDEPHRKELRSEL